MLNGENASLSSTLSEAGLFLLFAGEKKMWEILRSCECLIDILNALLGGEKLIYSFSVAGQKVQHQIFELDPIFAAGFSPRNFDCDLF